MASTVIQTGTGTTTIVLPGARGPAGAGFQSLDSQEFLIAVRKVGDPNYAPWDKVTPAQQDAIGTAVSSNPVVLAAVSATAQNALSTAIGGLSTSTTRANAAPNPTGVNAGGWVPTSAALYGARTADTVTVRRPGTQSMKSVRTSTTPSTVLSGYSWLGQLTSTPAGGVPVTPGQVWTCSIYGICAVAAREQLTVRFYDSSGTAVGSAALGALTAVAANTWTRTAAAGVTVPAGAAFMTASVQMLTPTGANSASGEQTNWQDFQFEQVATLGSYFDGGSGAAGATSHSWTGTANASPSIETTVSLVGYAKSTDLTPLLPTPQAGVDFVRQSTAPVLASGTCAQNIYVIKFGAGSAGSTPTGGTFTLTVTFPDGSSQTTAAITYDPDTAVLAASIQSALLALSKVGSGNVTAVWSSSSSGWVVTFAAGLAVLSLAATNNTTGAAYPGTALVVGIAAAFNVLYTATAPTTLQSVKLTNTSATQQAIVTIYAVPSGQSAQLGVNDVDYRRVLQPGDSIEYVADQYGRYELAGKVLVAGDNLRLTVDQSQILTYVVTGVPAV